MSSAYAAPGSQGYALSSQGCSQYPPSGTSSASSSQESIFSDAGSTQSSTASSISDDFRASQEDVSQACAQAYLHQQAKAGHAIAAQQHMLLQQKAQQQAAPSYADVTSVPSEQRQHPRRSSRDQKPPPLIRQCERKINFVDNLVGKHILNNI